MRSSYSPAVSEAMLRLVLGDPGIDPCEGLLGRNARTWIVERFADQAHMLRVERLGGGRVLVFFVRACGHVPQLLCPEKKGKPCGKAAQAMLGGDAKFVYSGAGGGVEAPCPRVACPGWRMRLGGAADVSELLG